MTLSRIQALKHGILNEVSLTAWEDRLSLPPIVKSMGTAMFLQETANKAGLGR
jgi:hypothetical protein